MVHNIMVFAPRLPGVTHDEFKNRYERHMKMVAGLCGDAAPVSHTRWYPKHDADSKPVLLAGTPDDMCFDCIVLMSFQDEAASGRFMQALATEEANAKIEADEAGFWDRSRMKVFAIGDTMEWRP